MKNWKKKAAIRECCTTIESFEGLSCKNAESATLPKPISTMSLITCIEYKKLHLFSTYVIRMAGKTAERLIWWLNAEIRHEQQKNLKQACQEPTQFFKPVNLSNFTNKYRLVPVETKVPNAESQRNLLTTESSSVSSTQWPQSSTQQATACIYKEMTKLPFSITVTH